MSKKVISDCVYRNGAIVAANSSKKYFPKEAKNYKFVWPRDAMYTCKAANILGLEIHERYLKWCMKAQGWDKTGLFYQNYHINGKRASHHFQPDQTGSVLITVHDYYKHTTKKSKKFEKLIQKTADGLCAIWETDHFNIVTEDLWEERHAFPDLKENFTYSLAICAKGLECANELIPNKEWKRTAQEMRRTLRDHFTNKFYRSFGKFGDERIDASTLGLVWPSETVSADDERMKETVKEIEKRIVKDHGVYRYEHDEYDGWMYKENVHRKKGAGYWPLLNFWMTIYYTETNDEKKALKYYGKVIDDMKGRTYIPEQFFNNEIQVSVSPLCWSHSMFIIASKKLGLL
ncbi:MAG: glycoside hydrolase family 15 protein [bacterium]